MKNVSATLAKYHYNKSISTPSALFLIPICLLFEPSHQLFFLAASLQLPPVVSASPSPSLASLISHCGQAYRLHCHSIVGCESAGACLLLLLSLGGAFTSAVVGMQQQVFGVGQGHGLMTAQISGTRFPSPQW